MKIGCKLFWLCLMSFLSIAGKIFLTHDIYTNGGFYDSCADYFFGLTAEHVIYVLDTFIVVLIFIIFIKYFKHIISQVCAGILLISGLLSSIMICNYCWQALAWNVMFQFRDYPLIRPSQMAKWGLQRFFEAGEPGYHYLLIFLLLLFVTIIIFNHYKRSMCIYFKERLICLASKTKNEFMIVFYYDLILAFFKRYLCREEFEMFSVKWN